MAESLKMVAGGWELEDEPLPYILVNKLVTTPSENYSCVDRLEEHLFRFTVYSRESEEVKSIIDEIESVYDFNYLVLNRVTFEGMLWTGRRIVELEPGLWQGIVDYQIFTSKAFSGLNNVTEATHLRDAIVLRAKQEHLLDYVDTVNVGFHLEPDKEITYPYCLLLGFDDGEFDLTTCSRQEFSDYSFIILCKQLDELEEIVYQLEQIYDFCSFEIDGKDVLINEWQGNLITEIEPGIWQAECNYRAILEKMIA